MGFEKIIQGSYNQANAVFGDTSRKQCACISLFAISFSKIVKQPGKFTSTDVDFILTHEDRLYTSLGGSLPNGF